MMCGFRYDQGFHRWQPRRSPCGFRARQKFLAAQPCGDCYTSAMEPEEAMRELTRLSEELGLYDIPPQVCITHMRHVPCRGEGCVLSEDPEDVRRVRNR
jgi:hypothetical protein